MKIFLTKRAAKNYRSVINYLTNEWGEHVAKLFEQKTIDFLDLLEAYPNIGTIEFPEKQIMGFQLTKQTRVFYRIKGKQIIILAFFDSRQNPKKKPK